SHASADDSGDRTLWPDAAAAGRRSYSIGGALEVRFQKHQVGCQDQSRRRAATHDLEHSGAERVRFLFKRQSSCRPSTLEPGDGKPHRGISQTQYADVQWLRRSGGAFVRRNGSTSELLTLLRSQSYVVRCKSEKALANH